MQASFTMNKKTGFGLTSKLVSLLLIFALVPMALVGIGIMLNFGNIKDQAGVRFKDAAVTIADKIDRNLFERYGDVQAFGLNRVVHNEGYWYQPGDNNPIVKAMNQLVSTYGIYYLTILVDTNGKVIAINSKDTSGKSINTSSLYNKNYSNTDWFRKVASGQFTTSMAHSAAGNTSATGTFIEDLHIDADVKSAYPGDNALTLAYSAPVYKNGKVIAYWSNRTRFSLVEEIFQQAYQELNIAGYPNAELTLLDSEGRIIVDYDPGRQGTTNITHDLANVIMKFNLAQKGVAAAQHAVAGKTGFEYAFHARKKITQAAGYTHLKGALGYPGMNWGVLVRVPEDEAAPWLLSIQREMVLEFMLFAAIAIFIGIYMGRKVIARILPVVDVAKKAAEGDLRERLQVNSSDEIGQMSQAFNQMLDQLNEMVAEVKYASINMATGAEQIADGNASLSQRTEEQATSLEETASAMEEMTGTVKQNADSANQARNVAEDNRQRAAVGADVVQRTVTAMDEINDSSTRISDIIGTIDGIAFQTNLLALNAAVEAARAGEQGRGFAVVASEVRSLAQRSSEAAKEIKGLIEDSVGKVKTGTQLVDESGKTLEQIIAGTQKVADIVSEIAAASQEQASGIDQVNGAITNMDTMTQSNAALVEEAAASSRSMQDQANTLNSMMEFFKLGSGYSAGNRMVGTPMSSNQPIQNGNLAAAGKSSSTVQSADNRNNDKGEWVQFK